MNQLPEEIKYLINNECDLLTLFKLSQTSKENLQIYQQIIFMKHLADLDYNEYIIHNYEFI